jgi:hypothetical protein
METRVESRSTTWQPISKTIRIPCILCLLEPIGARRARALRVNYHLFSRFGTAFGDEQFRSLKIHSGIGADFLDFLALRRSHEQHKLLNNLKFQESRLYYEVLTTNRGTPLFINVCG